MENEIEYRDHVLRAYAKEAEPGKWEPHCEVKSIDPKSNLHEPELFDKDGNVYPDEVSAIAAGLRIGERFIDVFFCS